MKRDLCNLLLAGVLAGTLPACETVDQAREALKREGAGFNDQVVEDAGFILCNGVSIGSIRRRYGNSPETAAAYDEFCRIHNGQADTLPIGGGS